MTLNQFRSWLYWIAKILGDIQAIRKGRILKRIQRRIYGRLSGKLLRRLTR